MIASFPVCLSRNSQSITASEHRATHAPSSSASMAASRDSQRPYFLR
jgi:hypothetical protein